MSEGQLFLTADKSRRDDHDVREGAPDGPVVGRIYKLQVAVGIASMLLLVTSMR